MGVLIFTADERPFKDGDYIQMSGSLACPPTAPDTTYILYTNKSNQKGLEAWLPFISYRLVIVCDKLPRMTDSFKNEVIIHNSLLHKEESYDRPIQSLFRFDDRQRVFDIVRHGNLPIPLALAWVRANRKDDIETWRRLAKGTYKLPDIYAQSILSYSIKPSKQRTVYPKKKKQNTEIPTFFRESDIYANELIELAPEVANKVRVQEPASLPPTVKKTQTSIVEWI